MPDISGIDLLARVREISPETMVIMITAFATVDTARRPSSLELKTWSSKMRASTSKS